MQTIERATTVIYAALDAFQRESGLVPLVVLVPRRVFNQYVAEQRVIADAMPEFSAPAAKDPREWSDVRIVEHERSEEIEVY